MANKADKVYFQSFIDAADCALKAANYLVDCLENYDYSNIKTMLETMHSLEHEGDTKRHEMTNMLAKAFVTPVDREDLELLSKQIDDVTDNIEEVLQRFYVDRIEKINPDAIDFAKRIVSCCESMKDVLTEFENFKKPAKLHELTIKLGSKEEECDAFYLKATLNVPSFTSDVLETLYWREIFDHFEDCADACEHVADCVDTVVMKNT